MITAIIAKGKNMDNNKLIFLFNYIENSLPHEIETVLTDSELDPHYSAVYTTNLIKSYIDVLQGIGMKKIPFIDVENCFYYLGYTKEEFECFEKKRSIESKYYIGTQY